MEFPHINVSKEGFWNLFKKVAEGLIPPTQRYISQLAIQSSKSHPKSSQNKRAKNKLKKTVKKGKKND